MEDERDKPWNLHTCKLCTYRSKSTFVMCQHVRLHRTRSKTDTFLCDSKTPELFECEFCEFSSNLKVDLTEHVRFFHEGKEGYKELEDNVRCYRCKNCDFETHSMLVLTKHEDDCRNKSSEGEGTRPEKKEKEDAKMSKRKHDSPVGRNCRDFRLSKGHSSKIKKLGTILGNSSDSSTCKKLKQTEDNRCNPSNLHTSKLCTYRSKSTRSKTDTFFCVSTLELFECQFCEFSSNLKVGLTQHLRSFHQGKEDYKELEDIVRCYCCRNCDYKTHSVLVLTRHEDNCNILIGNRSSEEEGTRHKEKEKDDTKISKYKYYLLVRKDDIDFQISKERRKKINYSDKEVLEKRKKHVPKSEPKIEKLNELEEDRIDESEEPFPGESSDEYACSRDSSGNTVSQVFLKISQLKNKRIYPEGHSVAEEQNLRTNVSTPLKSKRTLTATQTTSGKKHCCYYCSKLYVEISNHLIRMHAKEPEVTKIREMQVHSRERILALKELRLKGDDKYNKQVPPSQRIPTRKLVTSSIQSCVTCPICSQLLAFRSFVRHERRCSGRPANHKKVTLQAFAAESERLMMRNTDCDTSQDKFIEELLKPIHADSIKHEIESDRCLKALAERYAHTHRGKPVNGRQQLRRMARLLLEIKEIYPTIFDFEDCILNGYYDCLLHGVYKMCSLNFKTGIFGKPALAHVLRAIITTLINVLLNSYSSDKCSRNSDDYQNVKRFRALHEQNYGVYVDIVARRKTLRQKALEQQPLPTPEDVKLFSQFIFEQADMAYKRLTEKGFNYPDWLQLGKAELAKIVIFNRRRVSEVASMSLKLYGQRRSLSEQQKAHLSVLETVLADRYMVMTLTGKGDNSPNILLDIDQCKYLDIFVEYREEAGVNGLNQYLFGVPTSALYIDASTVLKEYSIKCGAKNPTLLRTTYLRKEVATLSQLLTMNDHQIGQIAEFMGHTQKIHEEMYRQDEHLFQVRAWAKFLSFVEREALNKYKGKSWEELVNIAENFDYDESDQTAETHVSIELLNNDGHALEHSEDTFLVETTKSKHNHESKKSRSKSKKHSKSRTRINFTGAQVNLMLQNFEEYINDGMLAPLEVCEHFVEDNSKEFGGRCGRDVYNWIQYRRNKKRGVSMELLNNDGHALEHSEDTLQVAATESKQNNENKKSKSKKRSKVRTRVNFTSVQVSLMLQNFSEYINDGMLAPLEMCEHFVRDNSEEFGGRCGRDVYNWIQYRRNKKREEKKH